MRIHTRSIVARSLLIVSGIMMLAGGPRAWAWDYEGHRLVNLLALGTLPTNFPSFVRTAIAQERIAFLSGEPDRWRNTPEAPLRHSNGPDHYFDVDLVPRFHLDLTQLNPFRYEFHAQTLAARAKYPAEFPPIDPQQDPDHTRALIGFLPWTIVEYEARLKSAFSCLKEFETDGTPDEIRNAQENIIYCMGVMGHFVGDSSQPLHTTKHHHGWVGNNPDRYATNYSIHAWIDGGYFQQFPLDAPGLAARLRPARSLPDPVPHHAPTNLFAVVLRFLQEQHRQVESLYRLEKEGKLARNAPRDQEGYDFLAGQLQRGAQMLGDLWLTAWEQAPPDMYLRAALKKRTATQAPPAEPPRQPGTK